MWLIAKYKSNEINFLKNNLKKDFGDEIKFYLPKIKCEKYFKNKLKKFERFILGNYIFFYHKNFRDQKIFAKMKYIKGIQYILKNFIQNQKEIENFIDHCKNFEDKNGYLMQGFFKTDSIKKAKFINGPFTNLVFSIISSQKNKIKILIGDFKTTIPKDSSYLYRPV